MDVVGAIANIWAVLEAGKTIAQICADYANAVKDAPWDLPNVVNKVEDLCIILERLHRILEETKTGENMDRLPTLQKLCSPEIRLLDRCLEEISTLKKKLDPPTWIGTDTRWAAAYLATRWPMKKSSVERALQNLEMFKSTFNLALSCDESEILHGIDVTVHQLETTSSMIHEDTIKIHADVNNLLDISRQYANNSASSARENLETNIFEWLSAPDPFSNYHRARKLFHEGTGSWLLESKSFLEWQVTPNSFLWLHGIPGCGKTILSSTILEYITKNAQLAMHTMNHRTSIAYFYFDFNDAAEKQTVDKMLRSLIFQLWTETPEIPLALVSLHQSCLNGKRQPTTEQLQDTLHEILATKKEVVIVLDALDESSERQDLTTTLETMAHWNLTGLHILATSRREADIEKGLAEITTGVIPIQNASVDKDIRSFIGEQLRVKSRWEKWGKDIQLIEDTLTAKSNGMFRWVVCQLDMLRKCRTRKMLLAALEKLPKTLEETYARILRKIDEDEAPKVFQLLQWLAFSKKPLSLEELAEVYAVTLDDEPLFNPNNRLFDPKDIMEMCSSLVVLSASRSAGDHIFNRDDESRDSEFNDSEFDDQGENNPVVRFAHFSVKEYLLSTELNIGVSQVLRISALSAHTSITKDCLAYLLYFQAADSIENCIDTYWIRYNDEVCCWVDHGFSRQFALINYAISYWTTHFQEADDNDGQLHSILIDFCVERKGAFDNWYRFMGRHSFMGQHSLRVESTSPLIFASEISGLAKVIPHLIRNGCDVNAIHSVVLKMDDSPRYIDCTALHIAALYENTKGVKALLSTGADINSRDSHRRTPLFLSATIRSTSVTQVLLDERADVESADNRGLTPLLSCMEEDLPYDELERARHDDDSAFTLQVVQLLLCKADLEHRDASGRSPLSYAIEYLPEAIKYLLAEGADILTVVNDDIIKERALATIAHYGDLASMKKLLDLGFDVKSMDNDGYMALIRALQSDNDQVEKVDLLLQSGAVVHPYIDLYHPDLHFRYTRRPETRTAAVCLAVKYLPDDLIEPIIEMLVSAGAAIESNEGDDFETNAMTAAIQYGKIRAAKFFLAKGAGVNGPWKIDWGSGHITTTPLHEAVRVRSFNLEIIKLLLEEGASPTVLDSHGETVLQAATKSEHCTPALIKVLLEKMAISEVREIYKGALFTTVEQGREEILELLLKEGADVMVRNETDDTLLHKAVRAERLSMIRILIEKGIDVDAANFFGQTALHRSVEEYSDSSCQCLLEKGADVSARDNDGKTALVAAVGCNNYNAMEFLLRWGAAKTASDMDIRTVWHSGLITKQPSVASAKILLENGVDVNSRDANGRTLLMDMAASIFWVWDDWDHMEFAGFLIENGADITLRDEEEKSALDLLMEGADPLRYEESWCKRLYKLLGGKQVVEGKS